jgi:hypothetical protein
MAGPIALASALSRLVKVTCPHCGATKTVDRRKPVKHHRVCIRCHKQFPDPLRAKRK